MHIGITYDLRDDYLREGYGHEQTAEFDRVDTIDGIDAALKSLGHGTDRIGNVRHLVRRLASGDTWDLVFNIAEGMYGVGREAQVPALLDAYRIPYTFSDPLVLALTLHKGLTKTVIRAAGIPTADFAVIEDPADLQSLDLPPPLFAKPVAEGTGKGISESSRVDTHEQLSLLCTKLMHEFRQPVLVETYLPGREFTAGIVGTDNDAAVIGVMEVLFRNHHEGEKIYSYHSKSNYEELIDYVIPEREVVQACSDLALAAWRALGCRDGGRVDIRMDSLDRPNFIEVNPLAGLNPVHSDLPIICRLLGIPFQDLIARILDSAMQRIGRKES
ncbi:MAG TPA: D-alanine--D-alanine ligase [Deltaproteobacteria bacterium]|nr:D-alanine--D-alanine ligase [Deltaproteobacteria bacterium]HOG84729.1 D-alanine--D-alanine ligase [Deltaproteobacteria bacterium]HON95286.1 D-alanine--D-alanine ligase [Deltaproteobacteria bacterium]HPR03047.1 D-alanine--D-alanine ligase [Deltaproteobacteria bacterium]HQM73543.1 D-alanine--D-alanine ligase [Deltaproteobacteria bacterium]